MWILQHPSCGYSETISICKERVRQERFHTAIHLNGNAVRACQLPVSAVGSGAITTIEGLSKNGDHPVQKAWLEHDVAQCGYCQTGQIMTAAALLKKNPSPTDEQIEQAMNGNICRCGTYTRIKSAIKTAAKQK